MNEEKSIIQRITLRIKRFFKGICLIHRLYEVIDFKELIKSKEDIVTNYNEYTCSLRMMYQSINKELNRLDGDLKTLFTKQEALNRQHCELFEKFIELKKTKKVK